MRSVFYSSLFASAAFAATTSPSYSNDLTKYLTQTDSRGVITGQPPVATDVGTANADVGVANTNVGTAATDLGSLATDVGTVPAGDSSVVLVPNGLPTGLTTLTYGSESFTASIGRKTTVIITTTPETSTRTRTTSTGGADASSNDSGSASTSSSSGGAAAATNIQVAGGALLGAAGLVLALL